MHDAEFNDPRLVQVYDAEGAWGPDDDYFLALVNETPEARVLDLGCGTGRLALALATAGHLVTGIDPSAAALAAASAKPGAERVTWLLGTAESAAEGAFDVAIMTGHVAQFMTGANEWPRALRALRRALRPGGRLGFHSYNAASRVWERWNPRDTRREIRLRDQSTVLIWTEVTGHTDNLVSYSRHYRFADGVVLRSDSTLRFWDDSRLKQSVTDAGFTIERLHGGWHGEPVGASQAELIVVASRCP